MRLVWFAFTLLFALVAIIGYAAYQANTEARIARAEVDLFKQKQYEQLQAGAQPMPSVLDPRPGQPPPMAETPTHQLAGSPLPPNGTPSVVGGAPKVNTSPAAAGTPDLPTTPPTISVPDANSYTTLTAQQSQLLTLPAIARIKAVYLSDGFVLIDAGSNKQLTAGMKFDLRRGAAVVGRVSISKSIEAEEAIADIQPASIPTGVELRAGDELVQAVSNP